MAATTTQTRSNEKRSVEELKKELPPDWELVTSPDVKKPYYWNKRTNETSWKFPHAEGRHVTEGVYAARIACILASGC